MKMVKKYCNIVNIMNSIKNNVKYMTYSITIKHTYNKEKQK